MKVLSILIVAISLVSCGKSQNKPTVLSTDTTKTTVMKTDEEWKKILTPEQYHVLRERGTERPFSGKYDNFYEHGVYSCAACGTPLFLSDTKFDGGCGWPSFFEAIDSTKIIYKEDRSHGMVRTEIICKTCGGHLGHVFDDGPPPTGKRYCLNSAALNFEAVGGKK